MKLEEAEGKNIREVMKATKTDGLFKEWVFNEVNIKKAKNVNEIEAIVADCGEKLFNEMNSSPLWSMTDDIGVVLQTILAGKVGTSELAMKL